MLITTLKKKTITNRKAITISILKTPDLILIFQAFFFRGKLMLFKNRICENNH